MFAAFHNQSPLITMTLFEGDALSSTQVSIAFEVLSHCGFVASTGEGSVPLVLSAALNGGQRWW